jgi:plastocyanin
MWHLTRKSVLAGAVASALMSGWLSGCSGRETEPAVQTTTAPAAAEQRITIDNFAFNPQVLTVAPGTKVIWVNRDDVPHTATSSESPPKFKSTAIDTDEQFSQVFTQPGTYRYFCAVHPKMTATIVVK